MNGRAGRLQQAQAALLKLEQQLQQMQAEQEQAVGSLDEAKAEAEKLKAAGTIVWNGPVGVFEFPAFAQGTEAIAHAIADSTAFSIAGGGDTLAAIAKFGITEQVDYISTGGGAFLEFLEGKTLPAVEVLLQRAAQ